MWPGGDSWGGGDNAYYLIDNSGFESQDGPLEDAGYYGDREYFDDFPEERCPAAQSGTEWQGQINMPKEYEILPESMYCHWHIAPRSGVSNPTIRLEFLKMNMESRRGDSLYHFFLINSFH